MFKKLSEAIKHKGTSLSDGEYWSRNGFVFMLGLLAASITERRAEIATLYNNVKVPISGIEPRSEIWGQNFPRQFNTWKS
ncbi:hypothetical protein MASR1M31_18620 [Porphyromonadaceae bacterium]